MVEIRHSLHPKYLDAVISRHEYIVESLKVRFVSILDMSTMNAGRMIFLYIRC